MFCLFGSPFHPRMVLVRQLRRFLQRHVVWLLLRRPFRIRSVKRWRGWPQLVSGRIFFLFCGGGRLCYRVSFWVGELSSVAEAVAVGVNKAATAAWAVDLRAVLFHLREYGSGQKHEQQGENGSFHGSGKGCVVLLKGASVEPAPVCFIQMRAIQFQKSRLRRQG